MPLTRKLFEHFRGNMTDWRSEAFGGVVYGPCQGQRHCRGQTLGQAQAGRAGHTQAGCLGVLKTVVFRTMAKR